MYSKIVGIIIIILLIANIAIAVWECFIDLSSIDNDTRIIITLSMVGSWAIMGGLAFSASMSE